MPGERIFDAAAIRKLAQRRVDESSLRAMAEEIGISKSGLDHFLKGHEPYSRTRAKLIAWSIAQQRPDAQAIRPEEVDAAIALLERYMRAVGSDAARDKRVREVTARLFHAETKSTPKRR